MVNVLAKSTIHSNPLWLRVVRGFSDGYSARASSREVVRSFVYFCLRVKLNLPINLRVKVFIRILWVWISGSKEVLSTLRSVERGFILSMSLERTWLTSFNSLSRTIMD